MSDFLLVVVFIFIAFGVFRRYILYLVVNAVGRRLTRDMDKFQQQQQPNRPQGHVTVEDKRGNQRGNNLSDEGDFVDYEEVKD